MTDGWHRTVDVSCEGLIAGMPSLERPKLRTVIPRRVEHQGQAFVHLQDPTGVVSDPILIPFDGFQHIVRHFDGLSTLIEFRLGCCDRRVCFSRSANSRTWFAGSTPP